MSSVRDMFLIVVSLLIFWVLIMMLIAFPGQVVTYHCYQAALTYQNEVVCYHSGFGGISCLETGRMCCNDPLGSSCTEYTITKTKP